MVLLCYVWNGVVGEQEAIQIWRPTEGNTELIVVLHCVDMGDAEEFPSHTHAQYAPDTR